ncbi:hypothetical protein SEEG9184_06200 [Salmonella enterica subsp. enterica serovar Gallinarum str. 9184]|nr:hypothetical protein SEEG9184_06200 [Salmonella enterica subsp. enterica serovar Gallinarum str. 9184]
MLCSKKGLLEQIYSFSVFPAPAGINRRANSSAADHWCVPRASGDKPDAYISPRDFEACSPRQRG